MSAKNFLAELLTYHGWLTSYWVVNVMSIEVYLVCLNDSVFNAIFYQCSICNLACLWIIRWSSPTDRLCGTYLKISPSHGFICILCDSQHWSKMILMVNGRLYNWFVTAGLLRCYSHNSKLCCIIAVLQWGWSCWLSSKSVSLFLCILSHIFYFAFIVNISYIYALPNGIWIQSAILPQYTFRTLTDRPTNGIVDRSTPLALMLAILIESNVLIIIIIIIIIIKIIIIIILIIITLGVEWQKKIIFSEVYSL